MEYIDKWNEIVANYNQNRFSEENKIQTIWEELFSDSGFFGYSKFSQEVVSQARLKLGSTERLIPDIIINNAKLNKSLFIVELKRYSTEFKKDLKDQLHSYIKQKELHIGVLICQKIYLYFFDKNNYQLSLEIPFIKDSEIGAKFIELFSKNNFSEENIKNYLLNFENEKKHIDEIQKLLNEEYIKNLVIENLQKTYTKNEIEQALKDYRFNVNKLLNDTHIITSPKEIINDGEMPNIVGNNISKSEAIRLFKTKGNRFADKTIFASKNKAAEWYWANPDKSILQQDWNLILNDWINKRVYLFYIPANTIHVDSMKYRSDKPSVIDLRIRYLDEQFTELANNMSFKKFLVDSIDY